MPNNVGQKDFSFIERSEPSKKAPGVGKWGASTVDQRRSVMRPAHSQEGRVQTGAEHGLRIKDRREATKDWLTSIWF